MSLPPKRILLVGSGAREHALAHALASEGHTLWIAPGNPGTSELGCNLPIDTENLTSLVEAAVQEQIDLVVIGPEKPLTLGLVDALALRGIPAFGPSRKAAQLEGSKAWMKHVLVEEGIPTAPFAVFDRYEAAVSYVRKAARPLVVKADGLAAGKGVTVASTTEEALSALHQMMCARVFGDAGDTVVIEEVLPGQEVSFHAVCADNRAIVLAPAQDYKRLGTGDTGPNTGGMGAFAPTPVLTPALHADVLHTIVHPLLAGMRRRGIPFRGALFVGLMIHKGKASVLEINVRFGDPETCVLVPLYTGSWGALLWHAAKGDLTPVAQQEPSHLSSLCVVMTAEGYPYTVRRGDTIHGLPLSPHDKGEFILHAGTSRLPDGSLVTSGGRVLVVGARASSLSTAAKQAYAAVKRIHWAGEHHRTDIGSAYLPSLQDC